MEYGSERGCGGPCLGCDQQNKQIGSHDRNTTNNAANGADMSGLQFDNKISLGHIISIGGITAYANLRGTQK